MGISVATWGDRGVRSLIGVVLARGIAAGVEPVQRNVKAAVLAGGLAHDVSLAVGVGRSASGLSESQS